MFCVPLGGDHLNYHTKLTTTHLYRAAIIKRTTQRSQLNLVDQLIIISLQFLNQNAFSPFIIH